MTFIEQRSVRSPNVRLFVKVCQDDAAHFGVSGLLWQLPTSGFPAPQGRALPRNAASLGCVEYFEGAKGARSPRTLYRRHGEKQGRLDSLTTWMSACHLGCSVFVNMQPGNLPSLPQPLI
jgi:hypothetical protein